MIATLPSPRQAFIVACMVIGFIALGTIGFLVGGGIYKNANDAAIWVKGCEQGTSLSLVVKPRSPNDLDDISIYCYNERLRIAWLQEAAIRDTEFASQRFESDVILFIVVMITLSGVLLAALQVITSYNLAVSGKLADQQGTNLTIESGKLSVQSSVTGVVILIVSFAFFYIFVEQVHPLTEVNVNAAKAVTAPNNTQVPSASPKFVGGFFGSVPSKQPPATNKLVGGFLGSSPNNPTTQHK